MKKPNKLVKIILKPIDTFTNIGYYKKELN